MDNIKAHIASEIHESVKNFWRRGIPEEGVEDVSVIDVTDLITRIRVKTPAGPRYFDVTVKETL